jgi:integrase/recombinase XerD
MSTSPEATFDRNYARHLQHLTLKGLQPKTIEAYSRAIRRIGERFDHQIDALSEQQLLDYFTELVASHSWSSVKLDLYGLKFYYEHVLRRPWAMPGLIKPPRSQRLPDIATVDETQRIITRTRVLSYRVFFFTLYSLGLRLGKGCGCRSATSMAHAGACISVTPRATRIVWCRCRKRPINSCAASGRCIVTRSCSFPVATTA